MKRIFISISLILFTVSLFAERKEITIWHSYRGDEQRALEKVTDLFNDSQDEFKASLLLVPYDAFANKLTSAIPRGNGPDGFIFAHERVGDWAESGIIAEVGPEIDASLKNDLIPSTLQALNYHGKIWGVPLSFKSLVLFYRTDLVDHAPKTLDELTATASRLTNAGEGRYGLAFEATSTYFAAPFIYGFGGGFCLGDNGSAGDSACLDNPGNVCVR